MPWRVVSGGGHCPDHKPFAVVRADTGSLVACHATRENAEAQVRALYSATEGE